MRKPLRIGKVTPSAAQVPQYGELELAVDLGATYENPFDPDEVRLDAVFTAPPASEASCPGFFMVDYRRKVSDGCEVMLARGQRRLEGPLRPAETGRYTWRLTLRDRTRRGHRRRGPVRGRGRPRARASSRQSKADPHYLAFDNGQGFFPIGHNLPIYHTSGQLGDEAMRQVRRRQGELQPLVDVVVRVRHRVDGPARLVSPGRGRPARPGPRPGRASSGCTT